MKTNLVLVLLVAIAFSGSSNLAEAADLVVEVESLQLSNAEVRDLETASGKVVAFDVEDAEAKGEVELDRGVYKAYLYMFAPDPEQDAVYVAIGQTKKRVYPAIHATLTESESLSLNILEKKKYPISITCGEIGVLLDRLVIQSIPGQAVTDPAEEISGPSNAMPMQPTNAEPGPTDGRPRVIATSDGEVDDKSSMVRFLLYSSDYDVIGIVENNSIFQKRGHSKEQWIQKEIGLYAQVYPNLKQHHPDYPSPDTLKSVIRLGNENPNDLHSAPADMETQDTPGSDLIIATLLDDDPRPVHVPCWGGANTVAFALWKLKTTQPDKFAAAAGRLRVYGITYNLSNKAQDGGYLWIIQNMPEVKIYTAATWAGTYSYDSVDGKRGRPSKNPREVQVYFNNPWLDENVKSNHGPLGAYYPQSYTSEGDTPSFLPLIANGLRGHLDYTYGSWGGRAQIKSGNHMMDAENEEGNKWAAIYRWSIAAQNDLAARMDWCVATTYANANHNPKAKVTGALVRTVIPGETIELDASATTDPDGNQLTYTWWQYCEADSAKTKVAITNANTKTARFVVPNESGKQLHIILEVTDNGTPPLTHYQRVICNIQ